MNSAISDLALDMGHTQLDLEFERIQNENLLSVVPASDSSIRPEQSDLSRELIPQKVSGRINGQLTRRRGEARRHRARRE